MQVSSNRPTFQKVNMDRSFIQEKINQLMNNICTSTGNDAICSLSPSVYDTAWVSMVQKPGHGVLFPQCFDYILQIQLPDGSWASEQSDTDGILSTLAACLALRQLKPHVKMPDTYIEERCLRAQAWLHSKFATWKIEEAERVGFEVLVPNLLRLLEHQGVHFNLTGKDLLMSFAEGKMSKFRKVLTGPKQTTLLHSLEALFGLFDYDSVKHHKLPDGSMLGSPSSTAAYLMSSSTWDVDAEAYLCRVVERRHTTSLWGGCPSAFPTTIFEWSWVSNACHTHSDHYIESIGTFNSFGMRTIQGRSGSRESGSYLHHVRKDPQGSGLCCRIQ